MSPEKQDIEHRKIILLAAARELSNPSLQDQMLLGGNFLTEQGLERGRRIVRLDVPEYSDKEPWLKDYCLKIVPNNQVNQQEMLRHQEIELKSKTVSGLKIPSYFGEAPVSDKERGFILERLKRDGRNNTIDRIFKEAKTTRSVVRFSEELSEKIATAFHALHEIGFIHGDVNEGNIYLGDIRWREETLPKEGDKVRPSKLRIAMDGEVQLLDFEKTRKLGTPTSKTMAREYKTEEREVKVLLDDLTLAVDDDSTTEEITEESDALFNKIRSR